MARNCHYKSLGNYNESNMKEITFEIPKVPISLNTLLRMHWTERSQLKKNWKMEIFVACQKLKEQKIDPFEFKDKKCKVFIHQYRHHTLDPDNSYGSCKILIDCLEKQGMIKKDSPKWIELMVTQSTIPFKKQLKTVITLEDITKDYILGKK